MVTLRPIIKENWIECIGLKVRPEQQDFVATNLYSIAESKADPSLIPMAIYNGEVMVGFTMYGRDPEDGRYWIVRLMIDERYQASGYGKQAMKQVITLLEQEKDCTDIYVSHKPANEYADSLYKKLDFEDTGEVVGGEVVNRLSL
jgi:diamine N-acetyltransferase